MPLDLRLQTAEEIADPQSELPSVAKQNFHSHSGRRKARFLESLVESHAHFGRRLSLDRLARNCSTRTRARGEQKLRAAARKKLAGRRGRPLDGTVGTSGAQPQRHLEQTAE